MKKIIIIVLLMLTTRLAHAGFNICYDGDGRNLTKVGSSPIAGCLYFNDDNQGDYDTVKALYSVIRRDFLMVENGMIVEIPQAEQDAILQAEADAVVQAQNDSVGALQITIKDAFLAWLAVYNSKVPAQYQISPLELKAQVKTDLGL